MNTYLQFLGMWNLIGCIIMLGFFNKEFGNKVLVEWTRIFTVEYTIGYWEKFWLGWAIGLNIFFALINIYAAHWEFQPLKQLCVVFDLIAYIIFLILAGWGVKSKRTGSGIYSVFIIFLIWILWGAAVLLSII